jgi:hypothetical protein
MKANILNVYILLKNGKRTFLPTDEDGDPKSFSFHVDRERLEILSKSHDFQMSLFEEIFNGLHLNEFFIQFFPKEYKFFISAIVFELSGVEHSFNYLDDFYLDSYGWRNEPALFLEDEFGRHAEDNYQFDDYLLTFGLDESNLKYYLNGEKSDGGWLDLANIQLHRKRFK